ncbi:MAG: rhodanese-like domain-containing protein [Anaerolineaceae bacterium]
MAKKKTKKTSQLNASLSVIALGVIMLAVALGVLLTQGNKNPTVVQVTRTSVPAQAADIPYPEIPRVSLADAKSAYDQGAAVFVDVRSLSEYETEHISGALSIPEVEMVNRLTELNSQDWIITYCT